MDSPKPPSKLADPQPFLGIMPEISIIDLPLPMVAQRKLAPLIKKGYSYHDMCEWGLNVAHWALNAHLTGNIPVILEKHDSQGKAEYVELRPIVCNRRLARAEETVVQLQLPPLVEDELLPEIFRAHLVTPGDAEAGRVLVGQAVMLWFSDYAGELEMRGATLRLFNPKTKGLMALSTRKAG